MIGNSITIPFQSGGDWGYLTINPEMYPAKNGIAPSGRYIVYCLHPKHGSCQFIIEQNKEYLWISKNTPPFIVEEFIWWIGGRIEEHNRRSG